MVLTQEGLCLFPKAQSPCKHCLWGSPSTEGRDWLRARVRTRFTNRFCDVPAGHWAAGSFAVHGKERDLPAGAPWHIMAPCTAMHFHVFRGISTPAPAPPVGHELVARAPVGSPAPCGEGLVQPPAVNRAPHPLGHVAAWPCDFASEGLWVAGSGRSHCYFILTYYAAGSSWEGPLRARGTSAILLPCSLLQRAAQARASRVRAGSRRGPLSRAAGTVGIPGSASLHPSGHTVNL